MTHAVISSRSYLGRGLFLFLALVLALPLSAASPPSAPGPAFPHFSTPEALAAACSQGLRSAGTGLKRLQRRPADAGWLSAYDAFNARLEDLANPLTFLASVHPDKAMRSAAEACELRWQDFYSSLGQNVTLYRSLKKLSPVDAIDAELKKTTLEGFDDSGVGLPPPQRSRAKQINDEVSALAQEFARKLRDAGTLLAFSEAQLKGVPAAVLAQAKRDGQGPEARYLLSLDYPTYGPVMLLADDASTRERMWRAASSEGGQANLDLLARITRLRKEYASLFGAASWDAFVLKRRMARTPERVAAFLDEVKAAVQAREGRELEELRLAKAAHLAQPETGMKLERWDLNYYTERLRRERHAVDQEAFRAYFPPQASLEFALRLVERLMGVRYQRVPAAKTWHDEVQTYAVFDAASGNALATLWVDLYPRDGKYKHAAVWGLRSSSSALKRVSQAALVVNFDRHGLTLDELETLLHELGHAVHNNLSATRHALQAGTSVKHDFVEAPSQMLEDWVYDKQVLKLFAEVCPSCKPAPDALIDQAVAARRFGTGVRESRQHLYASYDLALYGPEPRDPMALWAQMEGATPLGHVPGTMFPATFAHIASNYSAGYYGYLWSLVLAMDMRTAFAGHRLDPALGQRYRQTVLGQGSQREPDSLVREFLGRDFNAKAFFEELKK